MRRVLCLLLAVTHSATAGLRAAPAARQACSPAQRLAPGPLALILPPDSAAGLIVVEGGVNAIGLYMGVITVRILLSWFPQAQAIEALRPLFTVSDAYLNLFRGIVPPIGGIDISPIGAFFVLNLLSSSVASLGAPHSTRGVEVRSRVPGSAVVGRARARIDEFVGSAFAQRGAE
jgi:YggT family protein